MAYKDKEERRIKDAQRYRKNPELAKGRALQWNANHPEVVRERARQQYEDNPAYFNVRNTARRKTLRALIQQQKVGRACTRCGISDYRVLDFHHLDKNGKEGGISATVAKNWGVERILQEIAKCELLCANCHRILHWEERNSENGLL
jgi:hypothetical protein